MHLYPIEKDQETLDKWDLITKIDRSLYDEKMKMFSYLDENQIDWFISNFADCDIDLNEVDHNGMTFLNYSSLHNHLEVAQYFIDNQAEVNLANMTGISPLMSAASRGHIRIVLLLIEARADPFMKDFEVIFN